METSYIALHSLARSSKHFIAINNEAFREIVKLIVDNHRKIMILIFTQGLDEILAMRFQVFMV